MKQLQSLSSLQFGSFLRSERLARQYSLTDLAQSIGVTKGYLSRLENGKSKPSSSIIQKIAGVLSTDSTELRMLAGYLPRDVNQILCDYPIEAFAILRDKFGMAKPSAKRYVETSEFPGAVRGVADPTSQQRDLCKLAQADCFEWMEQQSRNSIHAVVTDPPYGLKEYSSKEKGKLRRGRGGVWRIPPSFDGHTRSPLPRFTVLTDKDKKALREFFGEWAERVFRVLVPGGHVFVATNPLVSHVVYLALIKAGFEKRGEVIRLVQTLRGGDRPKNAHEEFQDVTVMPRSCWEPWGLFRKPCEGRVQDNLRKWKTGGLRRVSRAKPFCDVIRSSPTRGIERQIAPHPSLKPQGFMRQIVYASLPLGEGIVLDPFMGAGSTVAAASAVGYQSIGIESDPEFFKMAVQAVPELAALNPNGEKNQSLFRDELRKTPTQATLWK